MTEQQAGRLRTYLGTAPGVGKTYAMLNDGWRRAQAGERVLVGWIERHGRPETGAQLRELEVIPPRHVDYRGVPFEELDLDAVLARAPDAVLIDELAHTNADGQRQRWQDVVEMLEAGIAVITTVNIANLVSVREYAAAITGSGQVESVADEVLRSGEVILVDVPPEVLRRRIFAGRVFGAEAVGGALAHYFRPSNLSALSALGRAWMDGALEAVGGALLEEHGVLDRHPRPVVVGGVSRPPWGDQVIRRATGLAADQDADLVVVRVWVDDGLNRGRRDTADRYRRLVGEIGGSYTEVSAESPARGIADAVRRSNAGWVVVARHRSRLNELVHGSVAGQLRRLLPDVEVVDVDGSEA